MKLGWIPNAICVVRIVLIAPLIVALLARDYRLALVLLVIAGISDGVDGFLAKTFSWQTRLGSLLDPTADKLLLISTFLGLTYLGLVPEPLTAIVILRDFIIVVGAIWYQRVARRLHGEPTYISKLNTVGQLLFVVATIVHAEWEQPATEWLVVLGGFVVFTSITSGLTYVLIWSRRLREDAVAG